MKNAIKKIRLWHIIIVTVLVILVFILFAKKSYFDDEQKIRNPAVAGSWYPSGKLDAENAIKGYLDNVKYGEIENIKAMIVPHAGWRASGQVAATAFKQLKDDYKTIILIGPSHTASFKGASITDFTHYKTPLGIIKVSDKAKEMLKEPAFTAHPTAHIKEHSLEIELPFLQTVLTDFEIIPIIIGHMTTKEELKNIAEVVKKYVDDKTMIVISSDFTHYGQNHGYVPFKEDIPENIKSLDYGAIEKIINIEADSFIDYCEQTGATICGRLPVTILLYMLDKDKIKPHFIYYDTSGRIFNDYTNSVSYVSIIFSQEDSKEGEYQKENEYVTDTEEPLTKQEQNFLLKAARETLETYLKTGKMPEIDKNKLTPTLKKIQGCFTTLNKNNNLRGCIGHILPQEELYKCVIDNVINAAVNDRRFSPVKYEELKDIEIEISVLSVPEKLEFSSGEDLKNKLRPEIDGVVLKKGFKQSTYLPQVWEQIHDKEQFLSSLCKKGGLSSDCWQDTTTEVLTYQAFVFSE